MRASAQAKAGAARLSVRGAAFGYAGRSVVNGVDLELRAGMLHGIVGANGSGKTTIVRGLLGLLAPLEGSVHRQPCEAGRPLRVRYVPQRESLEPFWPLGVLEVVEMGLFDELGVFGTLPKRAKEAARRALADVGLPELARATFSSLSGGQRQRVLIARALAADPDVIFLDEPTSGVDEEASESIVRLLKKTTHERGLLTVLVSHQRELLDEFADEIWLVRRGRIQAREASEGAAR